MTTIYHNNRCRKSRETLALLQERGEALDIVEYLTATPSRDELKNVIGMLGIPAEKLIRRGEVEFKEHYKGKSLSDDQWIEAMVTYPKLIERPIVIKNGKAAIGRPPENVLSIL